MLHTQHATFLSRKYKTCFSSLHLFTVSPPSLERLLFARPNVTQPNLSFHLALDGWDLSLCGVGCIVYIGPPGGTCCNLRPQQDKFALGLKREFNFGAIYPEISRYFSWQTCITVEKVSQMQFTIFSWGKFYRKMTILHFISYLYWTCRKILGNNLRELSTFFLSYGFFWLFVNLAHN